MTDKFRPCGKPKERFGATGVARPCKIPDRQWQEEALKRKQVVWLRAAGSAALIAAAGLGATQSFAQTTVITREPVENRTVVTTTPALQLTPVQRQTIYRTVIHERRAPAQATVEYRVGTRIRNGAPLYALPRQVAVDVPALEPLKYMVVNGHVLLVDPATSEVVAELAE